MHVSTPPSWSASTKISTGTRKRKSCCAWSTHSSSPARPLIRPKLQLQLRELKLDSIELETGRPRTDAYIVYLFLMLRGFNGGCKDQHARLLLEESITLRLSLEHLGLELPPASTLSDNLQRGEQPDPWSDSAGRLILRQGLDDLAGSRSRRNPGRSQPSTNSLPAPRTRPAISATVHLLEGADPMIEHAERSLRRQAGEFRPHLDDLCHVEER